jgi:hypothetical protein
MRNLLFLFAYLCFSSVASGQFQLKIPSGHLESIVRVEDTLYFWGENQVWRSTDWGETLEAWDTFKTDPLHGVAYAYHSGTYYNDEVSLSKTSLSFIRYGFRNTYNGGEKKYDIYDPRFKKTYSRSIFFNSPTKTDGFSDFSLFVSNTYYPYYTFGFIDEQGTNRGHTYKRLDNPYHPDSVITYKTYCQEHIIGYLRNQFRVLRLSDSTVFKLSTPTTIQFTQAEFWRIDQDHVGVFEKNTQFATIKIPDMSVVIKPYPVPFKTKYHNQDEVLFSDSINLNCYNITDGSLRQVQNLPANWQASDLYFLGSKYICFYSRANDSVKYTTDLGQTWSYIPQIKITSSQFNYMFDYRDSIYAIREGKLYTTPCNQATDLMKYRNDVSAITEPIFCGTNSPSDPYNCTSGPNAVFNNLGSTLVYKNLISNDFGVSWSELTHKKLFLDFSNNIIYGLDSIDNGTVHKSSDFGTTWVAIQRPTLNATLVHAFGFLAKGDTMVFNNYLSTDQGANWKLFVTNAFDTIYPNTSFKIVLNQITDSKVVVFSKGGIWDEFYLNFDGNIIQNIASGSGGVYPHLYNRFKNNFHFSSYTYQAQTNIPPYGKLQNAETNKPAAFYSTLPVSIAKCCGAGWKKIGISDHFLYDETTLYTLARHVIDTSSCQGTFDFRGITYQSGKDYILSQGTTCAIDTLLYIKKLPPERKTINLNLCQGDTLRFNSHVFVHQLGWQQTYYDTIPGQGPDCDSVITYQIASLPPVINNSTLLACQNQTIVFLGNTYTSDTIVFTPNVSDTICNSQLKTVLDFLPTTSSYTTNLHLCTGDSVLLYGKYMYPPFVLDTTLLNAPTTQPYCKQHIVICTEDLLRNDTLFSSPFTACTDSLFTYSGQTYSAPAFIPTQLNINALCGGTEYTPLTALPNIIDTLPGSAFCISTGIVWNGVFYNESTVVTYADPNTPCRYLVKPLVQLPCFTTDGFVHEMSAPSNNGDIPYTPTAEESVGIILAPNPASDYVILHASAEGVFTLQDQLSRILLNQNISTGQTDIPLSLVPNGIYSWRVMSLNGVFEGKLAVLRK